MTTIAGKPLCKLVQLLSAIMFMGVVAGANATVIATDDGFEARYTVRLDSTLTGNDIKNVAIFEWDDSGNRSVSYSYTIAGSGRTDLVHTTGFAPTSALVLGYLDAVIGVGDEKRHLYTLVDAGYSDFLVDNLLGVKFSQIFGQGEQFTIDKLIAATATPEPSDALEELWGFVTGAAAKSAFDPSGDFRVHKWSPTTPPEDVSVPATLLLIGLGFAGLCLSRRKRCTH